MNDIIIPQYTQAVRETLARRKAKKYGYRIKKSRTQKIHGGNLGGWQIVDAYYNSIMSGNRWELSLEDVEAFLLEDESELNKGAGVCCICGGEYRLMGNNPDPVEIRGRCCHECNDTKVIPARARQIYFNNKL